MNDMIKLQYPNSAFYQPVEDTPEPPQPMPQNLQPQQPPQPAKIPNVTLAYLQPRQQPSRFYFV